MYNKIKTDINNILDNDTSIDSTTFLNIYKNIVVQVRFNKYQELFDTWNKDQGSKKLSVVFKNRNRLLEDDFFFRKLIGVLGYLEHSEDDFFEDLIFTWIVDTIDELVKLMIWNNENENEIKTKFNYSDKINLNENEIKTKNTYTATVSYLENVSYDRSYKAVA